VRIVRGPGAQRESAHRQLLPLGTLVQAGQLRGGSARAVVIAAAPGGRAGRRFWFPRMNPVMNITSTSRVP